MACKEWEGEEEGAPLSWVEECCRKMDWNVSGNGEEEGLESSVCMGPTVLKTCDD